MVKKILLILLFFFSILCNSEDEDLLFEKKNAPENVLKYNGYYYLSKFEDNDRIKEYHDLIFLYKNGILLETTLIKIGSSFENENELLLDTGFINNIRNNKSNWGVFKIERDKILMETWVSVPNKKIVYLNEGRIINDTTFEINKISKRNCNENKAVHFIYHFRHFLVKPDSTNDFIK